MFIHFTTQPVLAEKAENHPAVHIPTVYEHYTPEPARWEYHVLSIDTRETDLPDSQHLKELGQKGWLLSSILDERISNSGSKVHYYFVRQQTS